jgi:hypothetical protein
MIPKMSIVVPYRHSYSDELRYMLRSTANIPHNDVFVIGDHPRFNIHHIPYRQTIDVAKNTLEILNTAVNSRDISEEFIWWHDDTYLMKPVDSIENNHRGYYADILKEYTLKRKHNYYTQRMQKTYLRLLQLGVKKPICYELHTPFVINKTKWREVSSHITPSLNKLSMYGNLNNIGGTAIKDVKVRRGDSVPRGTFISTHDSTFNTSKVGRHIKEVFKEKGIYEY